MIKMSIFSFILAAFNVSMAGAALGGVQFHPVVIAVVFMTLSLKFVESGLRYLIK